MKIFIAADHRGFKLKEELKRWLEGEGFVVEDCGAEKLDVDDDYVDFAIDVVSEVVKDINKTPPNLPFGKGEGSPLFAKEGDGGSLRGILLCGSGVGVDIAANRVKGVRCGLGLSKEQVASARRHDDINVLALAADYVSVEKAKEMVETFLGTKFDGGEKYRRRIRKLDE